jgi:hypothetical protein
MEKEEGMVVVLEELAIARCVGIEVGFVTM